MSMVPSPILDPVMDEFSIGYAEAGLLISIPMAIMVPFSIVGILLSNKFGYWRSIGVGSTLIAFGSLLRGLAPNFSLLLMFNGIYGCGWGLTYPNIPKVIERHIPPSFQGIGTGVYIIGQLTGTIAVLMASKPFIFAAFDTSANTFLFWGILAFSAPLFWISLGRKLPRSRKYRELPEFKASIYKAISERNILLGSFFFFINNGLFYGLSGWLPTLMGIKETAIPPGLITSLLPGAGIGGAFVLPLISERINLKKVMSASWLILSVPIIAIIFIGFPLVLPAIATIGFLLSGIFALTFLLPVKSVPPGLVSAASGLIISIGYIGGFVGSWILGFTLEVTGTFLIPFTFFSALALAAGVFSLFLAPWFEE